MLWLKKFTARLFFRRDCLAETMCCPFKK